MLEFIKGIYIVDLGIYLKEARSLILSDLHIGYEEVLNKQGVFIPRFHLSDLLKRIENIFIELEWNKLQVEKIIINGDLMHEFGKVSGRGERDAKIVIDTFAKKAKEIVLLKGNHDNSDLFLSKRLKIESKDHEFFSAENIYVCHGDKVPKDKDFSKAKIIIIGHEHPAVRIKEEGKAESFKCFLVGKFKDKQLIVQPSMNLLTEGTDVLNEDLLSPFLGNVLNFECFVVSDKVYGFGKLKEVKNRNKEY